MPFDSRSSPAETISSQRVPFAWASRHRRAIAHMVALLSTGLIVAFHLSVVARYSSEPAPIVLFVPIIVSAYLGGLWPGLHCTLLAGLAAVYYLFVPFFAFELPRPVDDVRLATLVLGGVLISVMSERLHRSRRESAARAEEYRLVAENISDVVWVLDLDSRKLRYVSPSVQRLRGSTAEEAVGEDFETAVSWLSIDRFEHLIPDRLRAFADGETSSYTDEVVQLRKDGSPVWTETVTRLVRNADNGHIEIYGTTRDIDERKRAQLELLESGERYRSLFDNMLEGYVHCRMIFDGDRPVDFEYLAANDAFYKLTGLADVAGKKASDVLPNLHDKNSDVLERHGRVARTGVPQRFETYVEGLEHWFAASVYSPRPGEFVSVFDNITERKRAQEALRVNEARLRLANLAANAGVWEWTPATGLNYWSDELWKLYGLEPNSCEPSYESWLKAVHPEDREAAERAVRESAGNRTELNAEWRVNNTGGVQRWLMSRGQPVIGANGQLERYIGIVLDITARKMIEEKLRDSEERFRVLVEQASDAIFLHDHQGRFSIVNRQACESLGYTREELLSMSVTDLETDFDLASAQVAWSQVQYGETYTLCGHHRRKDGTTFPVEVRLSLCEIRGSRYYLGLVRDITDRRRAEEALQELNATLEHRVAERTRELTAANRELESFSYSVSHDLRAPLRAIDGFARALGEDYESMLDATGRDYLNRVTAAAGRMGQLIDDLLGLSRISRLDLTRHQVDVSSMARSIAEDLHRGQPGRGVEFQIKEGVTLNGDHRLLRVLLENLLGNAFKFTAKKPVARIEFGSYREADGQQVCFVRDNGAGFDLQYGHKLFGAFQRLHSVREFPGTGIGLATAQRIINRHRGRVWAEGRPNEGATFYFSISEHVEHGELADGQQSNSTGGGQSG